MVKVYPYITQKLEGHLSPLVLFNINEQAYNLQNKLLSISISTTKVNIPKVNKKVMGM